MNRTIDVIIHPDGTIELLEPVTLSGLRRARLTILEDAADEFPLSEDDATIDALLIAAGLQDVPADLPPDLEPLSEAALDALWSRLPTGTPLSQLVFEDREETF
ncbi:MAG: hypothetical protein AB4911_22615 [Oscillochloridaceae bacterium umkhey_bin13]